MAFRNTIRVWSNETRATAGAKTHCTNCGKPVTWFTTVANTKPILLDGHDPVPLWTAIDQDTNRAIEYHDRNTMHMVTCTKKREGARTGGSR